MTSILCAVLMALAQSQPDNPHDVKNKDRPAVGDASQKQMDAAETDTAITAAIAEAGATSIKDMGKVMAALKAKYSGQMDFSAVGPAVKAKLGG